jgi:hypothetical protein
LHFANGDPEFLKTVVITGDETWVYRHDPETKVQSCHSGSILHPEGPPKKAQRVRSKVMVLLTIFFDYSGIVLHSYATRRPNYRDTR